MASDGGIFSYNAPFFGSTGASPLNKPIDGMESNSTGTGYRFVATDGGIFDFGSSQFYGSATAGPPSSTAPTVVLNQSGTGPSSGVIGPLGISNGRYDVYGNLDLLQLFPSAGWHFDKRRSHAVRLRPHGHQSGRRHS